MIKSLRLQNFRCFSDHTIELRPLSIIVGRNNAGKSTIIEALRLISLVVGRYPDARFREAPDNLRSHVPRYRRGIVPSVRKLQFDFETIFHRYGSPPSKLTAVFDTGTTVELFVGEGGALFAHVTSESGTAVESASDAKTVHIPEIQALPQVMPLQDHERILDPDYVMDALSSYLAPLHFRNQIKLLSKYFADFKGISEATWGGLEIDRIIESNTERHTELRLHIRDGDYVGEAGQMGHGLQMWLQTMWFLARSKSAKTVILDEPDVYMHADLQRRLIKLVRSRTSQTIITTHSVEILAEVGPDAVLVIDRAGERSQYADTLDGVQEVISSLGGVHNLQVTRIWTSDRMLLVEGGDMTVLERLHSTLFPNIADTLGSIPHASVGGWNGWTGPLAKLMPIKNGEKKTVKAYFLFDRDYHTETEIEQRQKEGADRGVRVHVWKRKELENYLIVPEAIARIVSRPEIPVPVEAVADRIDQICEALKDDVRSAMTEYYFSGNKSQGVGRAVSSANKALDLAWRTRSGKWAIVPGKLLLGRLCEWSMSSFGVSFGPVKIAEEMQECEIAPEVREILKAVTSGGTFPL